MPPSCVSVLSFKLIGTFPPCIAQRGPQIYGFLILIQKLDNLHSHEFIAHGGSGWQYYTQNTVTNLGFLISLGQHLFAGKSNVTVHARSWRTLEQNEHDRSKVAFLGTT